MNPAGALTIQCWRAATNLRSDMRSGVVTFGPVAVPLDEAAELSDRLLGGPVVEFGRSGYWQPRWGAPYVTWTVTVRGFIEHETVDALLEASWLLGERIAREGVHWPSAWLRFRLRFGELVPDGVGG